jgi:hypothetical protein
MSAIDDTSYIDAPAHSLRIVQGVQGHFGHLEYTLRQMNFVTPSEIPSSLCMYEVTFKRCSTLHTTLRPHLRREPLTFCSVSIPLLFWLSFVQEAFE